MMWMELAVGCLTFVFVACYIWFVRIQDDCIEFDFRWGD
jgi:hypothetical protein